MKNIIAQTKEEILKTIKNAVSNLSNFMEIDSTSLNEAINTEIEIEIPKEKSHGDFSSNIAM